MSPNFANRVVEAHEDRIGELEDELPDLKVQVTQVEGKVDRLGDKIDTLLEHAKDTGVKMDRIVGRVDTLEKAKDKLDWLQGLLTKLAGPGLVVGGALLVKLGEQIYAWIIK